MAGRGDLGRSYGDDDKTPQKDIPEEARTSYSMDLYME